MWEGPQTAYFSRARYELIMQQEANLTLANETSFYPEGILWHMRQQHHQYVNGSMDFIAALHPFVQIYYKGMGCAAQVRGISNDRDVAVGASMR